MGYVVVIVKSEFRGWLERCEVQWASTCGAVDSEIVRVRDGLRVLFSVLWVIPHVARQHSGDGMIETLDLLVLLLMVRRREGIRDAQNPAHVFVHVAYKLWTTIGQQFLGSPVFENNV